MFFIGLSERVHAGLRPDVITLSPQEHNVTPPAGGFKEFT